MLPLVLGNDGLEDGGQGVPEGVVFLAEEEYDAGRLRVEGGWSMDQDLLNDLFDAGIGDRHILGELIDGTSVEGSILVAEL